MADVIFVAILVGFFAIAWLYVLACDRIIGPDLTLAARDDVDAEPTELEQAA